ncbi:MAG TPA: hypothetical protein LFV92_00715 [Rickettsia endosymbiont of Ceroptres masudai]|nr:hypothetical protein [Rickettsia endosymbiont of Ceroptres masudai]
MSFPQKRESRKKRNVIPWLDHGIQLKILILLVFFIVFVDPVVKPRGDSEKYWIPAFAGMTSKH